MPKDVNLAIKKFKKALASLRQGVHNTKDQLDQDGVIQRFEFTFELFWKALKVLLEAKGIESRSPRDCLVAALEWDFLDEEEVFLNMLQDRNKMSHWYSKVESRKIFIKVKNKYLPQLLQSVKKIEGMAKK